ncbi:MAG TPA: PhoH family protein, partial [Ideonella sp.]|nr:PhoH family protein [Ideonella sp.]
MILRHTFSPLDNTRLSHLCGALDENLRAIEAVLPVTITRRQGAFRIDGAKRDAERTLALLESLYERAKKPIHADTLQLAIDDLRRGGQPAPPATGEDGEIVLHTRRADLMGRTPNQMQYLRQILSHDITIGIGPAGTGKTFLAVACAVDALERSGVQRIVLTRPAVEAG